ncbi:cathelicidin antimicrobial peptide [Erinaceus europaeus]|uniref:Cathelicidin antimicrobial peptide n=1 Tax=Erinaceus europaeus TaxID=9365 RepID=A0A1S3AEB2_ERIEU|nr:cathelicidin antimicrobial peptide [Erinaceus europaeus]
MGQGQADLAAMEVQRESTSLAWWLPLLLLPGLVIPPAAAQTPSYREAALRAVDDLNRQSSDANLYRLLELSEEPMGSGDPSSPKPINFLAKETVCPKTTRQFPEQCDFKENGVVKQCVGTVTLDQVRGSFDVNCVETQNVRLFGRLRDLIKKGTQKIGRKLRKVGQQIKDFIRNLRPREEDS